jgi:hypothetical protein
VREAPRPALDVRTATSLHPQARHRLCVCLCGGCQVRLPRAAPIVHLSDSSSTSSLRRLGRALRVSLRPQEWKMCGGYLHAMPWAPRQGPGRAPFQLSLSSTGPVLSAASAGSSLSCDPVSFSPSCGGRVVPPSLLTTSVLQQPFHVVLEVSSWWSTFTVKGSLRSAATMPPSRRRRFLERGDLEEKREEETKVIAQYGLQPLDDRPDLAPLTAERREALMRECIE